MKLTRSLIVAVCCSIFAAQTVQAQDRWPVSLEGNLGFGLGLNRGDYPTKRAGNIAMDALLGARLRAAGPGSLVAAGAAGVQGPWGTDECIILVPNGECLADFPIFGIFSLLGGWETRKADFRVLAGPAVVRAEREYSKLALVARVDWASALFGPISLIGGGKAVVIPSYFGDAFLLFSVGAGLRIR